MDQCSPPIPSKCEVERLGDHPPEPPGEGAGAAVDLGEAPQARLQHQLGVVDGDNDLVDGGEGLGLAGPLVARTEVVERRAARPNNPSAGLQISAPTLGINFGLSDVTGVKQTLIMTGIFPRPTGC